MRLAALIALTVVIAGGTAASAEARPASKGFFTEAGVGATGVLPPAQEHATVGPTMAFRFGYDLFSWLSVGVHAGTSSHEATVPAPPEGEWFQLYRAHADGRLGFRAGRIGLFAEGGIGAAYISSNVLGKVMVTDPGESFSIAFMAGGGLEYQVLNRHYTFGVAGDWFLMPQFAALNGVEARVFLRYTY
jgi:hypothetical protein